LSRRVAPRIIPAMFGPAMPVDFAATADDYARYRQGFPESLFDRLVPLGAGVAGQTVADVGTGAGGLARGFARRGCRVIGVDRAERLLEQARAIDRDERLDIEYRRATAEATGLPDASADVVSAGQCWHWFDRPAAMREAARVLRPDGRLVIAHFDWLPVEGSVVAATERLIKAHNWSWRLGGGNGMHPRWMGELERAGYRDLEMFAYDVEVPYTPESWRGRVRASSGVGASLPPKRVEAFDRALAALLAQRFPEPVLHARHRVFAVLGRRPVNPAIVLHRGWRWARR
jgi:ubiquinone/menaquinone biosynthesis C-methylase UbiE